MPVIQFLGGAAPYRQYDPSISCQLLSIKLRAPAHGFALALGILPLSSGIVLRFLLLTLVLTAPSSFPQWFLLSKALLG